MPRFVSLLVFLSLGVVILGWRHDRDTLAFILEEHGLIERLSAGLWFTAAVWSMMAGIRDSRWRVEWLLGAGILFLFGLRELDAQKWIVGWNVEMLVNYWKPHVPLDERLLIVGFLIMPALLIVILFVVRMGRRFLPDWKAGLGWTRDVVWWVVMLGLAVFLDKLDYDHTRAIGLGVLDDRLITGLEEAMEFTLGLYTLLLLAPLWQRVLAPGPCNHGCANGKIGPPMVNPIREK